MGLYRYMQKHAQPPEPAPAAAVPERGNDVPTMKPDFKPMAHQEAAVRKLFDNKGRLILAHQMGSGKSLRADSKVCTPSGWARIDTLKVGDRVIDPAGGHAVVQGVYPQGRLETFKVTFTDGTYAICSDDHLWAVTTPWRRWSGRGYRVKTLAEIRSRPLAHANGNLQNFIPMTTAVEFDGQAVPIDPYLLGLLLGDGHLGDRAVRISTADPEIVESVRAALPDRVLIKHANRVDYNLTTNHGPSGNPLINELRNLGLMGRRSAHKSIPPLYRYNSAEVRLAVLQGLFDSDGSVAGRSAIDFTTISPELADGVQELVWSLGGLAVRSTKKTTYRYKGMLLSGQDAQRLYITLPSGIAPFRLPRKAERYAPPTKYQPVRAIAAIEPAGVEECVCIAVDSKDHLFLADSFVVTHNTLTSIYGFEKMRQFGKAKKAIVVVPAGLRENFARSGVEKATNSSFQVVGSSEEKNRMSNYVRPDEIDPDKTYTIVSYDQMRRDPIGMMQKTGADTIIADEFHKVRNDKSQVYQALMQARQHANNFIGITASLINNEPSEVAKLLNLSEGGPPISPRDFVGRYTRTIGTAEGFGGGKKRIIGINHPEEFAMQVVPKVDYFETGDIPGAAMPRKDVKNVYVPMSNEQYHLYRLALNKLGPVQEYITRRDPNITLKNADKLFTQLTQARQISNSVAMGRRDVSLEQSAERTPKVHKVLQDTIQHLQDKPDNSVVLYSNLIHGGVDVLNAGLKEAGIPHALFIGAGTELGDGKVTNVSRSQGVEDFKSGKVKVIVLSGAGAEGLDLKNATAFYALDGHFNPERIMQAEARARRLGGQAQRPPEQRVVDVRRYQSVVPTSEQPGVFGKMMGKKTPQTTDEWTYNVAGRKFQTSRQFYDVLHTPHKYVRKEYYTKRDGGRGVRYLYAHQVSQPRGLFKRLFGPKEPEGGFST